MFPMNSMLAFELQIPMQVEKVFMASSQSVIDFEPGELCVLPPPSWNLNDCNFGGPVVSWIYSWMAANRFCLAKVLLWLMCTLSENNNLFDSTWLTNNTWEGKHKVGLELSPDRVGLKLLQLIPRGDNMTIVRVCVCVSVSYLPPDRCSGTHSCGAYRWCFGLHTPYRHPPAALNPR